MIQSREEADAALRKKVEAVVETGHPQRRGAALAALHAVVEFELGRVRRESVSWAVKVARESLDILRAAAATSQPAEVRRALAALSRDLGELSDESFNNFEPTDADVKVVPAALDRGAGPTWLAAYMALRSGALGKSAVAAPQPKQVLTVRNALKKAPRIH